MRQIHNFNGTLVEKNMFYFNSSIYYAALHGTHHVFQKSMNTALPLYLSVIVGNICCRYRKFAKK